MFSHTLSLFDWQLWLAPLIGLASAGLVGVAGYYLLASRRQVAPVQTRESQSEEPAPKPEPVNPYQYGSPKRRQAPRGIGAAVRAVLTNPDHTLEPTAVVVRNRSIGGLCLIVPSPVEVGSILHVRPMQDHLEDAWLAVTVRHCEPKESAWELGCQFVRMPSYGTLMLFG